MPFEEMPLDEMRFEELKRIWDSQAVATPELDVAAMEERVRKSVRHEELRATTTEFGLMAIAGLTALILSAGAIVDRAPLSGHATAVLLLGIAGYVYAGRHRRLREARGFDDSLRGRVDRAIANLDDTIQRDRRFAWWFILPMAIGTAVSMPHGEHRRAVWVWTVQSAAWVLAWAVTRWELRTHSAPRRRKLDQLRQALASGDAE